jgi:cytochrome c5
MQRFWIRVGVMFCLLAGAAFMFVAAGNNSTSKQVLAAPPHVPQSNLVRGYIAVAVGRSGQAESSGIYSRQYPGKNIYLPRVTIYLKDAQTGKPSEEARTDLSGRFSVRVDGESRYQLCWKSDVYGADCLQDIISAGAEPLFLGTVLIRVPAKEGFIASFGQVRFADNSPARTLEPLSDVNAFALVAAHDTSKKLLAEIPVNNFGDYLLPYLPVKDPVFLSARIEKVQTTLTVLPQAFKQSTRLIRYHLVINNHPPRMDAIVPENISGKRMQIAAPGDTVVLKANARDSDGDPVEIRWFEYAGSGTLSAKSGTQVKWVLPAAPGRYSVQAVASDHKGGYARYTVQLAAGVKGVTFSGVVAGTDQKLLDGAQVEVNTKTVKTDAHGRFAIYVPEADKYVFNIRRPEYGFYSKIYDRSVAGGRWTLVRATVAAFPANAPIHFVNKRSELDCPGPDSARINWSEGPALQRVWYQDGKGNNVSPSQLTGQTGKAQLQAVRSEVSPAILARRPAYSLPVILPWQHKRRGGCGPGISVSIPANSLQRPSGAAPTGQVEVTLSTVDLDTPEQMPGDDGVKRAGGIGWMQSYGAGSVGLRDTGSGDPLELKSGMLATIVIPVDASQLMAGGPLKPTVPLLYYDEKNGIWQQQGVLILDATKKNYVASVKHLSSLNTDVLYNNPSCVRVQSSLPTPFDMEVIIPLGGGAAPKFKKITITDAPPYVIYHLPNNTNITITAIAPGVGATPPRSIGIFVVNTGPPQAAGFGAPPPASACATEVTLSNVNFPPNQGEFLHGLFSFAATTINEADIPTPGTVSHDLDVATQNYYAQVDPVVTGHPNGQRLTFTDFRTKNGFTSPPGFHLCAGVPCEDPDAEINTAYANSGDLGFGRDMHCRRTNTASGFDYACYVTNYGNVALNSDDHDDANDAFNNNAPFATVAMEYSRLNDDTDLVTDRHVKFYVYNALGARVNNADLDGHGRRPVPQLCMVCHGGAYPGGGNTGVPGFTTPDEVKLGSRFIPFDVRFLTFPSVAGSPDKTAQQSAMKHLNQDIVAHVPPLTGPDPLADVISAMYPGAPVTQNEDFVVNNWKQTTLPNTAAQEAFYKRVVSNTCRTCHVLQPFANVSTQRAGVNLQFSSAHDFLRNQGITGGGSFTALGQAEQRVCSDHVMPHAQRTFEIFWGQYWENDFGSFTPTIAAQFQAFGDTMSTLPRPAGWPGTEAWPPSWNGQLCGPYTGAGSTPPSFYSNFVQPLWSRNYALSGPAISCTTCHSELSGTAVQTQAALLSASGLAGLPGPVVITNDATNSPLILRLHGTGVQRMPQGCPSGTLRCLNESGGTYDPLTDPDPNSTASEINRVIYWINHGALP